MCRYHQLWGGILIAYGVGVLTGIWLENHFFCYCFAAGMMLLGLGVMRK